MSITYNTLGDCIAQAIASGRGNCDNVDKGILKGIILTSRNWKKNLSTDSFNLTTYKADLANLSLIPYNDLFALAENHEENQFVTSDLTGAQTLRRKGLPGKSYTFDNEGCAHKSLYNKNGNRNYNLIEVYEKGLSLVKGSDHIKGFSINSISVANYNSVDRQSVLTVQFSSAVEYNEKSVFLTFNGDLDFDATEINGVIETAITGTKTTTAITVKVSSACNSSSVIAGADDEVNWSVTDAVTGSAIAVSAVTYAAPFYTLTATTTAQQKVNVSLNFTDSIGEMYKGSGVM